MPHASFIRICAYCPEQHIISITGDPSPELVEKVKSEHLPTRKVTPELCQALEAEDCTLSHGMCDKAEAEYLKNNMPVADSGITTGGIQARLLLRAYVQNSGGEGPPGAVDFHQVVQNLIEKGADRAQVAAMLGRIRDSYPEGDHHKAIAQAEIDWVEALPELKQEAPNEPQLN